MNDNLTKTAVVGNTVVTIGILVLILWGGLRTPSGNYLQDVGNTPNYGAVTSTAVTAASFASTLFSHLTNLQVNSNFNVVGIIGQGGDGNTGTVLQTQVVTGTCITSSSTILAFQNPFAATSTMTQFQIAGTQGATTTDILVATSSSSAAPNTMAVAGTSTLGENIMGLERISTSTTFYSVAGAKIGPGKGYANPTGNVGGTGFAYTTNIPIVLGPSEWVLAYSTSSWTGQNTGAQAAGIGAVPASCSYKAELQN